MVPRSNTGTPTAQALIAASVDENLQFVRYLVDPRKAEAQRQTLTLAVEGDTLIQRLELRNGVLVITEADAAASTHLALTRQDHVALVPGTRSTSSSTSTGDALVQLDRVLDRSRLMPPGAIESLLEGTKATRLRALAVAGGATGTLSARSAPGLRFRRRGHASAPRPCASG